MKKAVRITAWILGLLLLLQVGAMVVLQSPRVQTFLGRKVIEHLQDKMDADISFASASVRPFDALVLEEVLVKDRAPEVAGMDTLLYVKHLSARFSIMGLLKGESIYVNRLNLDGGCFHLVIDQDPHRPDHTVTNLQRVFRMDPPEDPNAEMHWGNILHARSIEVSNVHFHMENIAGARRYEERGVVIPEGVIDWNHLNLVLEHLKVSGFRMADDLITATVQDLNVQELETGWRLDGLSAHKVRVGKGNIHLEDFEGVVGGSSRLVISSLDIDGPLVDYEFFEEKVSLDITLKEGSCIDMQTISHLAPGLEQMSFRGRIRGRFHGTVSDFTLSDMLIEGMDDAITLRTTGRMAGLPDAEQTRLNFQIGELSFGLGDLDGFIANWAPGVKLNTDHMAPGERFTLSGTLSGVLDQMNFCGDVDSRIGLAQADIQLAHAISQRQPLRIGGRLHTQDLHLGRILGEKALGPVTLTTRLEAQLPQNGDPRIQIDTLSIDRLQALGYDYSGISAWGHYHPADFDLHLLSSDPNLRLSAQGSYQETPARDGSLDARLSLDHANLEALNLDKRGKSLVALAAEAHIQRTGGRAIGDIDTHGTTLENAQGRYAIDDVNIHLDDRDSLHLLTLQSKMLEADFQGSHSISQFIADLKNLVLGQELQALTQIPAKPYSGASYQAHVYAHRLHDLLAFVAPGFYVENGTQATLSVTPEGLLNADVTSGRVALKEKYVKDMKLHVDNDFDALTGTINGSSIALSGLHLNNSLFTFYADDNQVGLGYVFDNEEENDTRAELYVIGELARNEKGLSVTAHALPSNIYYKGNGWGLHSGNISWQGDDLHIDRLLMRHEDQQLLVDGGYSKGRADTLSLTMDQFDLSLVNTIAGSQLPPIEGRATGHALVISSESPSAGLLASIVCDSTRIDNHRLGQLSLSSVWDEESQRFNAQLSNQLDGRSSIQADAFLAPSTQEAGIDLKLDRFELGYAAFFLNTVFHDFSGALSGEVRLAGPTKDLKLSSKDLQLDDGLLTLDFTRVPYHVQGPLSLDDEGLHFVNTRISDGEGGTGRISGGILFKLSDLENIHMDTHVSMRQMRAISLPRGVNPIAFGNVYASGKVDVTGPLDRIVLTIDATSAKSGEFHLPLGSSSSSSSHELLTFKEAPSTLAEDPYEQMMAAARQTHKRQNDFLFTARIKATPDLRVFIDIDEDNSLNAVGSGTIELESRASQGSLTLGGDYTIQDGSFHFGVLNLVSRNFSIQDGSSIRFNGDLWDTDLDVKGLYVTKANLSNLIPSYDESDSGSSARRTVNCGINISGKMRNPQVDFDIEIPDLSPIVQGQVESALNSEDKVQKQFVYLLIAGNFLPTEESGVTTNGSDVLFSNVSSIMSGQLNNIFQKLDIPLDLGLNYQTTQAGRNLFDVAVSTQLFNNRVIVNGTVGNKQLAGGVTTSEVAGDLDIEIKLNRSGSLRLSLFSHSADQFTYYLDNSQRNGGGIAFQREFNSFGQFFREFFAGRKKRESMALEAATRPQQNVILQIDTAGKSAPAYELR